MEDMWEKCVADEQEEADNLASDRAASPSRPTGDDVDGEEEECEGGDGASKEENGFHDLVPTTLEDLAFNEEMHTAHLVEGDFFPEDSPSGMELRGTEDRDDTASSNPDSASTQVPLGEKNVGADDMHPPRLLRTQRPAKRVRWADEGVKANPLVQHATTFLLPHIDQTQQQQQQQPGESDKNLQIFSPLPVLREERNTDGTTYLSCKAQRPARRFVMRKRGVVVGDGSSDDLLFQKQPSSNSLPTPTITLLAALHPPYQSEHVGPTVAMCIATICPNAKLGEALCDGGLQMPMVRPSEIRNVPLHIPF